jgi:hypothetical protein
MDATMGESPADVLTINTRELSSFIDETRMLEAVVNDVRRCVDFARALPDESGLPLESVTGERFIGRMPFHASTAYWKARNLSPWNGQKKKIYSSANFALKVHDDIPLIVAVICHIAADLGLKELSADWCNQCAGASFEFWRKLLCGALTVAENRRQNFIVYDDGTARVKSTFESDLVHSLAISDIVLNGYTEVVHQMTDTNNPTFLISESELIEHAAYVSTDDGSPQEFNSVSFAALLAELSLSDSPMQQVLFQKNDSMWPLEFNRAPPAVVNDEGTSPEKRFYYFPSYVKNSTDLIEFTRKISWLPCGTEDKLRSWFAIPVGTRQRLLNTTADGGGWATQGNDWQDADWQSDADVDEMEQEEGDEADTDQSEDSEEEDIEDGYKDEEDSEAEGEAEGEEEEEEGMEFHELFPKRPQLTCPYPPRLSPALALALKLLESGEPGVEDLQDFGGDYPFISTRAWKLSAWLMLCFIREQAWIAIRPQICLAFAMSRHPRLGQHSPAACLPERYFRKIIGFLEC